MVTSSLFDLRDRLVVITGAGGLLGQEHSLAVGRAGGIPILLDLSAAALRSASDRLAAEGLDHYIHEIDLTIEDEIRNIASEVQNSLGSVWGLVNNVASNPPPGEDVDNSSRLRDFSISRWDQDIRVGLTSAFLCSRYFGESMAEAGRGSIVNVASDLALISPDQRMYAAAKPEAASPPVKPVSYSVVKAGILGLTKYLATYWSPIPVRCNTLLPGSVQGSQNFILVEELISRIPLARLASPDEYHGALVFLLADASTYMTGANLVVDGGRTSW